MKKFTHFVTIVALMLATNLYAKNPDNSELQAMLSQYMDVLVHNQNFSGEILIVHNNERLFKQRVGLASIEHQVTLSEGTKYSIASITKTLTAAMVVMAQQDNRLKLTDRVSQYIPQLANKFGQITIADLLSHRSGLPHHDGIKDYWPKKSKIHMNRDQVLHEINQMELLFEPGMSMHYSSPGYFLLATALASIYDKPFAELRQDIILDKLNMTETGQLGGLNIVPKMANGYHVLNGELKVAPYRNYSMLSGAGDMYSTPEDLIKWAQAIHTEKLLKDKQWKAFYGANTNNDSTEAEYNFGWYRTLKDVKKFHHGGGTWGFSSYLALYPVSKSTIIILGNVSQLAVNEIGDDIEQMIFSDDFNMPAIHTMSNAKALNLNQYTGVYKSTQSTRVLRVFKVDEGLFVKLGNNPAFRIYNQNQHHFFGKKVNVEFTFKTEENHVKAINAKRNGQDMYFIKTQNSTEQ